MSFPFNHHHHSHHHRRDDDDERPSVYPPPGNSFIDPPQPQPPFFGAPPPETHVFHTSHVSSDFNYSAPPPPGPPPPHHHEPDHSFGHGYAPAPAAPDYSPYGTSVRHVSHESHHHTPHFPVSSHNAPAATVHHVSHEVNTAVSAKPTVRVFTKAAPNFSLTIRRGEVILAPSDPTNHYQHWYKDEKYSTRVKDEEGCPAFSLINKATGEALKHSIGATRPVRLIPYKSDYLDESILWTESRDLGDGHRTIRMVNNIRLNVDAFHGDKNSGGVHDGTSIVLWEWNKGDNQLWKIVPY
ncbi:ricin B-like lectin R40G3 [Cajanus cajan]|nr:ricin B-like lectin R40G3 [Cajanus cajan]